MKRRCDLLIIGAGFAGSLLALVAARLGLQVIVVDKARHPRFVIGESTTPLTNLLLEQLAHEQDLPELLGFTEWGRWQQTYNQIPVGLKRGFTFLHHRAGQYCDASREAQLLVAASPNNTLADTHWFRAAFDQKLMELARARGATFFTGATVLAFKPEQVQISIEAEDEQLELEAPFLVDASGARGFLFQRLELQEADIPHMPSHSALFTHFTNVPPLSAGLFEHGAPYPPEDAAVHHLFEGGWVWSLCFNNGLVSAGISAEESFARELRLHEGHAGWNRLLARFPTLAQQLQGATPVQPFHFQPKLSFRSQVMIGPRWAMLPSAAGFLNPLLSTGFPLTLLGIRRMVTLLQALPEVPPQSLKQYAEDCAHDFNAAGLLTSAMLRRADDFDAFAQLSLLYFASSIWAETQVRAGGLEWLYRFPLGRAPFWPGAQSICQASLARKLSAKELQAQVQALIEPYDIAQLTRPEKRNWHPFPS
ncbi:MAG TPA: FAD-dependent oxidoreductase [Methylomirabilota bacterium]|nr:FAD-dependent oxidoreductase [Methylomirabilota bacterium]